jgi:hypothetical protein
MLGPAGDPKPGESVACVLRENCRQTASQRMTTDPLTRPTAAEHVHPLPCLNPLLLPSRPGRRHLQPMYIHTYILAKLRKYQDQGIIMFG